MFSKILLRLATLAAIALLAASHAYCVNIIIDSPSSCETAKLSKGIYCYTDSPQTIQSIPLALKGGKLIKTAVADARNTFFGLNFSINVRSEVYVCCDSRVPAPSWLSTWVATDMTVPVGGKSIVEYKVYAKRYQPGTVRLPANQGGAMYFVVVKDLTPKFPHNGWVLLTYDMPYLREIIKKAPEYDVNHIQISHDIMMNTYYTTIRSQRQDINELIDLAHAYGVPEVTLWTHEVCTWGIPPDLLAPDGRSDGNNPALWEWIKQRYVDMLTPGIGCPEADGIVLTFSEVSQNVYKRGQFKHDGFTEAQSVAKTLNTVQQACKMFGKSLYARTWVGFDKWAEEVIRDGILINGDTDIWIMNKNVGGIDWPIMDTHMSMIGTLPPQYKELIEFDLNGEYMGKGRSTFIMTQYLKDHWNYALERGADGAVSRIDRKTDMTYYTSNRINLYSMKEVMANPSVDARAVNLEWCRQQFPVEIAEDIADHYDDPDSPWEGDTRYMTWKAYRPKDCPLTTEQALDIAYKALKRLEPHKTVLEQQTTLNTRDGVNDYITLTSGINTAIEKLRESKSR